MEDDALQDIIDAGAASAAMSAFDEARADGSLAFMDSDDVAGMADASSRNPYVAAARAGEDLSKTMTTPAEAYGTVMQTYFNMRSAQDHFASLEAVRRDQALRNSRRLRRLSRFCPGGRGAAEGAFLGDLDDSRARRAEEDMFFS